MMKETLIGAGVIAAIGGAFVGGYFVSNYNHLKNTPESVITKMESAKAEAKSEQAEAEKKRLEAERALSKLESTKLQYQNEIKPEIEKRVRKELETYISKADEKYEAAKHERELADLKLELIREKQRFSSSSSDQLLAIIGGIK